MKFALTLTLISLLFSFFSFAQEELPIEIQDADHITYLTVSDYEKSGNHGFPSNYTPRKYDPINKESYDEIIVGPTYKNGYSKTKFWRYVTVYNVEENAPELISQWPAIFEDCHDKGQNFGIWSQSISYNMELSAKVGAEALGFSAGISASVSEGVSFTVTRSVNATEGIRAKHLPYFSTENYEGITYIETYNTSTKQVGYYDYNKLGRFYYGYPYKFRLTNQNCTLMVKRTDVEVCEGYNKKSLPHNIKEELLYPMQTLEILE